MAQADLSRLSLRKGAEATPSAAQDALTARRRRKWIKWGVIGAGVAALAGFVALRSANAPTEVELTTASTAYPTQSYTLLNATGRVVAARRKAA